MNHELKESILSLVDNARITYVSSIDVNGFPNTKAMFSVLHDGMKTFCFSTNYSSKRRKQFQDNAKSCIYFCDGTSGKGLMLVGCMQVCTDRKHREMLWFDGAEKYYPKGIDDEDYCVFEFIPEWGNYYHSLQNWTFTIDQLINDGE